jgi:MFS family permease
MGSACIAKPSVAVSGRARRHFLSPQSAFYIQASITLGFLAGSAAPTPLYAVYRAQWGFSPTLLTVVFGVYALAVLFALLVAGRLSDHVGRRPVLVWTTFAQALVMVLFTTAHNLGDLLLGRVLQGLSAGAAIAAVGAALLDLDKVRGAVANSVAPMLGTGLGGLTAGLTVQYLPAPTHLIYGLLGVLFALQGVALFFDAETGVVRAGALASLRPSFALPSSVRRPLLLAAPVLVAVWALAGFYASLGPTLLREIVGAISFALGGIARATLAGSGAFAVVLLRTREALTLLQLGSLVLIIGVGVGIGVASLSSRSLAAFLVGTAVAGIGFGSGFQGAIRTVITAAPVSGRAGVLSLLFVVSYVAMGIPAMVAGARLAGTGDITRTAREFAAAILVLAAAAALGTVVRARSTS